MNVVHSCTKGKLLPNKMPFTQRERKTSWKPRELEHTCVQRMSLLRFSITKQQRTKCLELCNVAPLRKAQQPRREAITHFCNNSICNFSTHKSLLLWMLCIHALKGGSYRVFVCQCREAMPLKNRRRRRRVVAPWKSRDCLRRRRASVEISTTKSS